MSLEIMSVTLREDELVTVPLEIELGSLTDSSSDRIAWQRESASASSSMVFGTVIMSVFSVSMESSCF